MNSCQAWLLRKCSIDTCSVSCDVDAAFIFYQMSHKILFLMICVIMCFETYSWCKVLPINFMRDCFYFSHILRLVSWKICKVFNTGCLNLQGINALHSKWHTSFSVPLRETSSHLIAWCDNIKTYVKDGFCNRWESQNRLQLNKALTFSMTLFIALETM